MLNKYFNFFCFLLLFCNTPLYSKNNNKNNFISKNLSSYFSAITAYDNQKNSIALKYFNSSKSLINIHEPYLEKYIFSLVMDDKIDLAIKYVYINKDKKSSDFFEAYLLLIIDNIKKKNFKKANKLLSKLESSREKDILSLVIYENLKSYIYLFENKKIISKSSNFGDLSLITSAFQGCYLGEKKTRSYFSNLIRSEKTDYSRYIFFYINYLLENKDLNQVKNIVDKIDILNSNLLVYQTKNWINDKQYKKISKIFSCKNEQDLLSEFLFIVGNLYSNENQIEKSNFYLNLSNYLNPEFKFNLTLLSENYYNNDQYIQSKNVLRSFKSNDDIYYWHKIKKLANIIFYTEGEKESIAFIFSKFKKIEKPSPRIIYDMANIFKGFKKFEPAIKYYNELISNKNILSESRAEILYRRGGSYERIGEFKKSDKDLLEALKINPNDSYILNYLAYSWLERNYKINTAIKMLEKAYQKNSNDPYILDSVGWGYYLIGDFKVAEKFLQEAIILMPNDPIVNDHYGDILWKVDKKLQAHYYWKSVLNLEDVEEDMKDNINVKLLKGLIK